MCCRRFCKARPCRADCLDSTAFKSTVGRRILADPNHVEIGRPAVAESRRQAQFELPKADSASRTPATIGLAAGVALGVGKRQGVKSRRSDGLEHLQRRALVAIDAEEAVEVRGPKDLLEDGRKLAESQFAVGGVDPALE